MQSLPETNFFKIVIGLAVLILSIGTANGTTLTEGKGAWGQEIILESDLIKLVIVPDSGGRIRSLIDKRTGKKFISWIDTNVGEAGSLDDRAQSTLAKYDVQIINRGPEQAAVKLTWHNSFQKVTYAKTISLVDRRPLVSVQYVLKNDNPEPIAHMIKCHFLIGGPANKNWYYHMPTRHGYHRENFFDIQADKYFRDWFGGWFALIDEKSTEGVAIAHQNGAKVQHHYVWDQSPTFPTYEWTYQPVEKTETFEFDIVLTRGLDGMTDVTRDYAVNVKKQIDGKKIQFNLEFQPLKYMDLAEIPTIAGEIRDIDGATVATLSDQRFPGLLKEGSVHPMQFKWSARNDGSYVLVQKVTSAGKMLGEYELPFVIGQPTGTYLRGASLDETTETKANPVVSFSYEDLARGWVVTLAKTSESGKALERLRLDMGQREWNSVGLAVTALKDIGELTVSLAPFKGPHTDSLPKIELMHLDNHTLRPYTLQEMKGGNLVNVWLSAQTVGTPPGTYQSRIQFKTAGGEKIEVPLSICVWPVEIPRPRPAFFMCWYQLESILHSSLAAGKASPKDLLSIWKAYAEDIVRSGMTGFSVYPGGAQSPARTTGQIGEDGFPTLDLSGYDPYVKVAREAGMNWVAHSGGAITPWAPPEKRNDPKYITAFYGSVTRQFYDYFKSKGFGEIWMLYIDECPLQPTPDHLAFIKAVRKTCPGILGHAALSPMSIEQLQILDPFVERWTPSGGNVESFLKWTRDGKVKLRYPREVGYYTGAVAGWKSLSYTKGRSGGWQAVALGLRRYNFWGYLAHNTEYGWGVYPGQNGPIGSVGWEGVVEGNQDFCYAVMLRDGLEKAQAQGIPAAKLAPIEKTLNLLVGETPENILQLKRYRSQGSSWLGLEAGEAEYRLAHRRLLEALTQLRQLQSN